MTYVNRIGADTFQIDTVNGTLFEIVRHPTAKPDSVILGGTNIVLDAARLETLLHIHQFIFAPPAEVVADTLVTPPNQITDPVFPLDNAPETTDEKA